MDGNQPTPLPEKPNKNGARRSTQQRRSQIAAAALDCLLQFGHGGVTARRVAERAGMSLGHLTYHFADMHDVHVAAWHLAAHKLAQPAPLPEMTGLLPSARFLNFLQAHFAPSQLDPHLIRLRIDLAAAAQTSPEIAKIDRALFENLRAQIETYLSAMCDPWKLGRLPMVETMVLATIDGLWRDYMRHQDTEAIDAVLEACAQFAKMRLGGS